MFCRILFFLVSVNVIRAQSSCGIAGTSSSFIINGTDSERGNWPWIASIHRTSTDDFLCGGTFIGSKFIITAAHCIQNKNLNLEVRPKHPTEIIVKLGKYDLSKRYEKGAVDAYVNEIILHPDWKPHEQQYTGDAAILVLESVIQVNSFIFPICLSNTENIPKGKTGIVVGWGKSESAAAHENTPKQLEVTVKSNEACFLADPRFAAVSSSTTFCAGKDKMSGPCSGDSGSGLFVQVGVGTSSRYFLRGIVSAGFTKDGFCDVSVDVIYTNVLKVLPWINQVTGSKEINQNAPQPTARRSKEIFCFFESWAEGRGGKGAFSLSDLKPELCTTLVFLHAELDGDNLKSINPVQTNDEGSRLFKRFTGLKKKHPHLKTLLSIGSWNEGSEKYSDLAADSERRKRFAGNSVAFLKKYGFDGLHVHWEYPAHRGGSPEDDKENFVELLQELRNVFNPQQLYLSAFLRVQTDVVRKAYDLQKIGKIVDAILMMTYDMSGPWDRVIKFPAALSGDDENNLNSRVNYFIAQGAPAEKLILGLPFFGRTFTTNSDGNIDDSSNDVGFSGPFFKENSFLGYNEFCFMKNRDWSVRFDSTASQAIGKFQSNGVNNVVLFDTPRSVANKVKFANGKNLGGVWIWFVDSDDFRGDCEPDSTTFADYNQITRAPRTERDYPLLRTINEAFEILKK